MSTNKIKLSQDRWISLYGELSEYVLAYSSLDPILEEDENGDEHLTEEKQDEFCGIVDVVEAILGRYFIKEEK
tara:strand:+ start:451 stop:669 length:219 start_codon:yes stop_codon:yes gene_type:complete